MRALVTGGSGSIGKQLLALLAGREGLEVAAPTSSEMDVTDADVVARWMREVAPDVVFHLAGVSVVRNAGPRMVAVNVVGTYNVLAAAPEGCRFVLASSATVYGDRARFMASERCGELVPSSTYGATKLAAEALCRSAERTRGVSPVCLRLVAQVGPGVGHGLVRDVLDKLAGPCPRLQLLGDYPGSTKPFLHVSDTARALAHFGLDQQYRGVVNVSNYDNLTVDQVASVVMRETGVHKPVEWLGEAANWKGDNRVVSVDPGLAETLGFVPRYCSRSAVELAAREAR